MSSQTTQQNPSSSPGTYTLAKGLQKGLSPGTTYLTPAPPQPSHYSPLVEVGKGARSTVFSFPYAPLALKKMHPGLTSYPENAALYEYHLGAFIHRSFEGYRPASSRIRVRVPAPGAYVSGDSSVWDGTLDRLPNPHRTKTPGFTMEMIQSLPDAVRVALVFSFYPRLGNQPDPFSMQDVLKRPENRHCLVRPCLGEVERSCSNGNVFSLRDLDLGVRDMQRVGMDVKELASAVGEAFAVLHWRLGVTGWGVEFVIGTSLDRESDMKDRNTVHLYLVNFGDCRLVHRQSHSEGIKGVLADAMLSGSTRRFIPNPLRSPQLYWVFKTAYLAQANKIGRLSGDRRPEEVMGYYEEQVMTASG